MKKFVIPLLLSCLFLQGCENQSVALKEKCSKYIPEAQERINNDSTENNFLSGIFYSKTRKTCISITKGKGLATEYRDELTGQAILDYISDAYSKNPKYKSEKDFEETLNLIK